MGRSLERLRQAVINSQDEYSEKLLGMWDETVPAQYANRRIDEAGPKPANGEDPGWAGSLDQEGILKIQEYLNDPSQFLILRGSAGTGKSTLAATIGRHLVGELSIGGRFTNSLELFQELSFRLHHKDPVGYFASFGVLVIDDLGVVNESISPHQQKALWGLIEARWSSPGKYTIITTNMPIKQNAGGSGLSEWIGESGWDRIVSDLTRVTMHGESLR